MQPPVAVKEDAAVSEKKHGGKLGTVSGVYIPVCLNIISILMFLRFGVILGRVGFVGIIGLLVVAYCVDFLTLFSLSAIASNGEVKGGGAYYLISRSLGPEFGGSIGIMLYLAAVLNSAMNVVGLIDCIRLNIGPSFPEGYWAGYGLQTIALVICSGLCLLSSTKFSKASNGLLAILSLAVASIPASALFKKPFHDEELGIHFTGVSLDTLADNFLPHTSRPSYSGVETFRELFGILFPATAGILAGASLSGDLKDPSKAIPKGTLWATLTTFIVYFVVVLSMASSTTRESFLANPNVIPLTNLSQPVIFAGECAVTAFSALMGIKTSAGLFRALARDKLLPGFAFFDVGFGRQDDPIAALTLTYVIAQIALLADLNHIATFISMGFQMTFFVMNLACFLLKICSAPNFRPGFKFFNWQTASLGSLLSAAAMFFIDETYASLAICVLIFLFLLIHYLCPPKRWGDVSQNLIYHQVRKYLLRLKPEHIKFWRPHIILLINNPRRQTRLIRFCNSMKKGSLYILGHVIVTDDFNKGVEEARLQQNAWSSYISESSRIKAFVQLTMSPSITWGVRNLILSAGLGGMRPNIAVLGFYNMNDLRNSNHHIPVPDIPSSPAMKMNRPPPPKSEGKAPRRRRGDTSARLLEGVLPTDVIRTEEMMSPVEYMTILEDLALRHRMNVAVGYGFETLESPRGDGVNNKKYVDLWPIQMSASVTSDGKNVLTTNFDTYTLILQLGHILKSAQTWRNAYKLRVMVFVEYESEVGEESARVRALLEKLRIDAKVMVFWLASGDLNTYELIINGNSHDIDWEIIVNDALRDEEWWDDLQRFRGQIDPLSSQEIPHITHILDSTSGRPGVYNPHEDVGIDRRRSSFANVSEMPKRPGISVLTKLGVNIGMHTHHLQRDAIQESEKGDYLGDVAESSSDEDEEDMVDYNDAGESSDPTRRPLLSRINLEESVGEAKRELQLAWMTRDRRRKAKAGQGDRVAPTYGTMSTSQTLMEQESDSTPRAGQSETPSEVRDGASAEDENIQNSKPQKSETFPTLGTTQIPDLAPVPPRRARSMSPMRAAQAFAGLGGAGRPGISRQSSGVRFSSRPVPETTVVAEGEDSKFGFLQSETTTPKLERPTASRQSSYGHGRFSSRPMPETRLHEGLEGSRTISFAEEPTYHAPSTPHSATHSRHHSLQASRNHSRHSSWSGQGDVSLSIPELVGSYKSDPVTASEEQEAGSTYSTQSFSLSFNDLPNRAQHLILNELLRRNSADTAVLMTTMPIPSEGTSQDEADTIRYLSDVEVLCNELPPTLMVLSNNMTVTVSL